MVPVEAGFQTHPLRGGVTGYAKADSDHDAIALRGKGVDAGIEALSCRTRGLSKYRRRGPDEPGMSSKVVAEKVMAAYALAADVGGTNMRAALVGEDGHIHEKRSVPTEADEPAKVVTDRLMVLMTEVRGMAGQGEVAGIGLAVAGPTEPETGTMRNPPNLPQLDGYSPKPALEEAFRLPVIVSNDATLAALGEHRYGAGRGHDDLIYLTVSTGVGGGVVVGGRLYHGARGFAGEAGQMVIDPDGPECGGGSSGCVEALCSGTAVARIANERLTAGERSLLANGDGRAVDSRMVVEAARAGDRFSLRVLQEVGANLGICLVNLLHVLDPEIIVLGGGMSNALDLMLPFIDAEIDRRYMIKKGPRAKVVKSELGDEVGLLGAAAAVFAHSEESGGV